MHPRRYVLVITAPIVAVSVLLLMLGGAAGWYVHRLNQEVSELLAHNQGCMVASQKLVLGIRDARMQMLRFLDTGDEGVLQAMVPLKQMTSRQLRDAEATATTDEIRRLIGQARRNHDQFFGTFSDVPPGITPAARKQIIRELTQTVTSDVLSPAERLLEQTQQTVAQHTERNRSMADNIGLGLLLLGACGAVGGLMAGFGIARGIARRIEQSERAATRSEQLAVVGQLAAGLAHELRNPLTAMRVLVEVGREQSDGSEGLDPRDLQVLDEEISRLEKLVESFLDFARPPQLERTTLDVRNLVEQTLRLVGGPARQREVTIDCRTPADPVRIPADPVQMRQVLLNLLLNAIDAAGASGMVTVEVGQESSLPETALAGPRQTKGLPHENWAVIHVSDNGRGVPGDLKEKIFEPFFSSKETGIGLGLAVSQRIVEAHGGTIAVTNDPGGGGPVHDLPAGTSLTYLPGRNMQTLLIVDDEKNVFYSLEKGLKADGYTILTADTAKQAIELVRTAKPDAVLLDVRLPDMSGLDAFDRMRAFEPRLPVIIVTAHGTTDTAIEAMKRGAYEYLLKPVKLNELRQIVARAIEVSRLSRVPAVFDHEDEPATVDRIVGHSAAMQRVYKDIGRVAGQDVNILILGESGTGKELVARAIFHHSARNRGPFLAINAAAIPETLLESELFGHERGSFTGADRKRLGKFEQANHGTLFLDEIGDMSNATQAKVLRVLQDGRFERVGGSETIQTDVRAIAATNQNLEELIEQGRFRQDLYYRLKVFTIELPTLRERLEDLPRLLDHFIKLYNRELGKQIQSASAGVLQMLGEYSWPGNVRELQSAVKYALVHACGNVLTPDCFPESCRATAGRASSVSGAEPVPATGGLPPLLAATFDIGRRFAQLLDERHPNAYHTIENEVDRFLLTEALRLTRGNQVEASRLLGISRTTLRAKLESLGLSIGKHVQTNAGQNDQSLDSGT